MKREYTESTALRQLASCSGVKVGAKTIEYHAQSGPGLRGLGAIDYLRAKHGYRVVVSGAPRN